MVLPNRHPENYAWPVRGCDVFVASATEAIPAEVAQSLLEALADYGAKSVVIFGTHKDHDGNLSGLHFWPGSLIQKKGVAV